MQRLTAFKNEKRQRERQEAADRCVGRQFLKKERGRKRETGSRRSMRQSTAFLNEKRQRERHEAADRCVGRQFLKKERG